ncbi:MAG TPA: serine hydrolase domain-containing protein, partial [Acidimicrobiia bacterium]|nr:serine hydrolase domain-containing protein [Acidimicrobiia bacterium]
MAAEVGGHVEPGFEGVRDAFANNFAEHGEVGATYAFYVEGTRVVDLWGGERPDRGVPYDGDTLQIVFSSTKGAAAACAHLLAQRGRLDLDAPVVEYWPEFGQAGKDHIPVRWLLSHQAGLPTIDAVLSREEALAWEPVIRALEVQKPYWEPGTAHGYHALTYGYLVGELVRRTDGRSLGTFFHEEFAEPLGLEFWIGLPEEYEPRVAPMIPMGAGDGASLEDMLGADSLMVRALNLNGAFGGELGETANHRDFHAAELPGANGIANARSLAKLYAGLIDDVLTPEQIAIARTLQTSGTDQVLSMPGFDVESTIALGFWSASPFAPMGGRHAFGHYGAGGSVGFADPEHHVAA